MISVVPTSVEQDDLSLAPPVNLRASWFTRKVYEANCALCRIGYCMQRLSTDIDFDGIVAVHGVLGEA